MSTEFDLAEELRTYNLTSEEQDTIKLNESKLVDKKSVKEFIETMRKENARKTAEKDPKDIAYDELQVAWETAKDNKELADVKETLQKKSEEMMKIVDVENPDMSTAAELEEWLKINNSIGSKENEERNQKIGDCISSYFEEFDQEHGLSSLTPQQAEQLQTASDGIRRSLAGFDPFAVQEDGKLVDPRFAPLKKFYDSLTLTDDNGQPVSPEEKAKYLEEVKKLAKEETITRLTTDSRYAPTFTQADAETKNKMILDGMLESIMESQVSLVQGYIDSKGEMTSEDRKNEVNKLYQLAAEGKPLPPIPQKTADGVLAGRWQHPLNTSKRVAQKVEKRGFWGWVKEKSGWNSFEKNHPHIAGAAKFLGTMGLTITVGMYAGSAGLAILSGYRTYQAIKRANDERKEKGSQESFFQYIWHNKRHLVSIGTSAASTLLAGVSSVALGAEANGVIGQQGFSGAWDLTKNLAGGAWNAVTHPLDTVGNMWDKVTSINFSGAGDKMSNIFSTEGMNETQALIRKGRLANTIIAGTSNLGLDLGDALKEETWKGKFKGVAKAFGKAFLTGAGMYAMAPGGDVHAAEATAAGAAGAAWDMDKSLTENIEANQFHPTMPGVEEQEIKVPYAPGMQPDANEYVESQENLTRWGNRIDQFLEKTGQADEIKDHIYGMIDKGEIKLPEGIETKEEYLYKMIMKMEQRPIDVTSELDAKLSTLSQEKMLASMSAEDFNKVSADLNDYSDKGVYHGSNTAGSEHHASHSHDKPIQRDLDEEKKGLGDDQQDVTPPENNIIDITKGTMDKMFKDMFGGHINDEETLQSDLNQYHQMMTNGAYDQAEEYLRTIYNNHINPNGEYIPFEESQLLLANNDYKNALLGNSAVYFDEQQNQDPVMPELSELDKANKSFDEIFRDVMGAHMREEDIQDNLNVYHEMMAKGDAQDAPEFLNHLIQGKDIDAAALNEAHHNVLSAMGRDDDSFIGQDPAELEAARLADKQLVDELRIPEDQRDQVRFMDTGNGKGAYYINEDGSLSVSNNLGERMANESIHTPSTMTPEEHQHAQEKIIYDNLKNQENLSEGEKKFLDHYAKQESATPENAPQQEIKGQQTETVPQGNQEYLYLNDVRFRSHAHEMSDYSVYTGKMKYAVIGDELIIKGECYSGSGHFSADPNAEQPMVFGAEQGASYSAASWAKDIEKSIYTDKSGITHVGGVKGSVWNAAKMHWNVEAHNIEIRHRIYMDLQQHETRTPDEMNFMAAHEAQLKQNCLMIDPESHQIKTDYKALGAMMTAAQKQGAEFSIDAPIIRGDILANGGKVKGLAFGR